MARRLQKSAADYMAIAVTPALIMLLVGSLLFFLLEVGYRGQYAGRLNWVLFWFVIAAVLIARIEIEMGSQHAAIYLCAFGIAVSLVVFKFVDRPWIAFPLLGLGWWCAKKLTWDCTLIDDSVDASGEGLLAVTGLDAEDQSESNDDTDSSEQPAEEVVTEEPPSQTDDDKKPHAPGQWVIYFSLAALPLFGLGQLLIPASNAASRSYAFRLLCIYVAAGLALLVTTSFLGLRRYLRQRKLKMPAVITGSWAVSGALLAGGVLLVCLLMPRPHAEYTITDLVDSVSEEAGNATDQALRSDDAGKGDGRRVGKTAEKSKANKSMGGEKGEGGKNASDDSKSTPPKSGEGEKSGAGQKSGKGEGGEDSKTGEKSPSGSSNKGKTSSDRQSNAEESESSKLSEVGQWVAKLVKWVIYAAMAFAAIFLLIRHRRAVLEGLARFWADIKSLFAGLWGKKPRRKREDDSGESLPAAVATQPFEDFSNPFLTGRAARMPLDELVRYTYAALEAWAEEAGVPRSPDRTVKEFMAQLAEQSPRIEEEARRTGRIYERLAYSDLELPENTRDVMEAIWRRMSHREAVGSV